MTKQTYPDSSPGIDVLSPPRAPTLATVIDRIAVDPGLTLGRRRNICSALRTMAKAAGGVPEQILANPAILRQRLAGFHPEQARITGKRWRNVRSEVTFAFKRVRPNGSGGIPRRPLLPAWQALHDAAPDRGLRWGLWRLFGFCSSQGIGPEGMSDAVIASFHQELVEGSLCQNPGRLVRQTIRLWNRARRQVQDWPAIELTLASRSRRFSLPLETFTAAFQADTATFLGRLAGHDPFCEDGPPRPLAAATLHGRHHQIRALASALVLSGIPRETIVGLADLVTPDRFRLAMEFMLQRTDGRKSTKNIHDLATAAVVIAKHHVRVDAATLARLRQMTARLDPRLGGGLTEKNRRRLRQFNDQHNKALLLHLPRRLRAEAEARGTPDRKGAMLMQMAVAIELSLMCMLRRKNLVHLDAERHLRWSRAGREGVCHLGIEATEVKNGESLEFELPRETADLVKLYLERYQPLLFATPCSWLFPGHGGKKPKDPRNFSDQITRCVLSRTGLEIHLHLFRHICAKLHLDAHPGSYEVLTRILGHRSSNTLRAFYCGLEMMAAARHVDAGILAQRTATRPLLARRGPRRCLRKVRR